MKTAELTGAELDFYVAKAEGWEGFRNKHGGITVTRADSSGYEYGNYRDKFDPQTGEKLPPISFVEAFNAYGDICYSTDWGQGGPIIDRELISVMSGTNADPFGPMWTATIKRLQPMKYFEGSTTLIAAMRAYVASKFGDEVPGEQKDKE